MTKGKKRKPDLRKIRTTKVYQLQDIADGLNRSARAVRAWIKAGLPVLDGSGPPLVDGAVLKKWLHERSQSRKQKCLANELYCFKCRKPRTVREGSLSLHPRNGRTMTIKALCGSCGTQMNKATASANLAQIQARFRSPKPHTPHLVECADPGVNRPLLTPSPDHPEILAETDSIRPYTCSPKVTKLH